MQTIQQNNIAACKHTQKAAVIIYQKYICNNFLEVCAGDHAEHQVLTNMLSLLSELSVRIHLFTMITFITDLLVLCLIFLRKQACAQ